jgi:hypothetical protein
MFCACLAGASLFALATAASASTITPTSNFFPYAGSGSGTAGDGVVAVSAPSSTAWTAVSNASWLSIVTGTGGTGNGSVTFSVAANSTDAQRVGTLTIAGQAFTVTQLGPPPATGSVQIVEYHNSAQDDYFITADPAEQQALDAAAQAGAVWSRTGMSFNSGGSSSVYRFIYRSSTGVNTHFYTVNTSEQSGLLANYPIWSLESPTAFYMTAANANQTCPTGTVPVYRAAQEQTGSHRFTTIQSAITEVLNRGWTNEGVAFCAPGSSPTLQLVGVESYAGLGTSNVTLHADQVMNGRSTTSGSLRLELWALSAPYAGSGATGYKVAQTSMLDVLAAGASYYNISQTVSSLATPPAGTWYLSMFLTEYTAASSNDGFVIVDSINFSSPWTKQSAALATTEAARPIPDGQGPRTSVDIP